MEGEAREGEAGGLDMEMVSKTSHLWRPMAGRQLIRSAPSLGREIVVWEKFMLRTSGLLCPLLH